MDYLTTEAVRIAEKSCCHFKHGALIFRKGKIVASACNDEHSHAEVKAVLNLSRILQVQWKNRKDR
jgi:deoxycytidylate deaminase